MIIIYLISILVNDSIRFLAADAYFKAIIDTIADVPKMIEHIGEEKHSQNILIPYVKEFMSILLVAPVSTVVNGDTRDSFCITSE